MSMAYGEKGKYMICKRYRFRRFADKPWAVWGPNDETPQFRAATFEEAVAWFISETKGWMKVGVVNEEAARLMMGQR